jgi:nucleotide-binding universal stress UspA family protein
MLKDIAVHIDGSADDDIRIAHAQNLASVCGYHVTGIFTNPLVEYAYVLAVQSGLAPMEPILESQEEMRKAGDRAVASLHQKFATFNNVSSIQRLDVGASQIVSRVVRLARWTDMFVALAPYGREAIPLWNDMVEGVMFESGRPIYLVPDSRPPIPKLESVLIAWSPTREASRAIVEVLPLLRLSKNIRLVTVDTESEFQLEDISETDIISAYFGHHGIPVSIESLKLRGRTVPEILYDEAHEMNAGLVVMGAYGHSRLREWVLGGTTRDMIKSTRIPLLLAH